MPNTSPHSTCLETRVSRIEATTSSMQTAQRYIEGAIEDLEEDAKFTRRTALTSMVSILSAVALAAFAVLLRQLGGQ